VHYNASPCSVPPSPPGKGFLVETFCGINPEQSNFTRGAAVGRMKLSSVRVFALLQTVKAVECSHSAGIGNSRRPVRLRKETKTVKWMNNRPRISRRRRENTARTLLAAAIVVVLAACGAQAQTLGIFGRSSDVGTVTHAGSAQFLQDANEYRITGGGANIWGEKDAFHYLWSNVSGDLSLTAKIQWIGDGKNPHRKAGWMVRQSLAADAPYADAVVHGDGLTSLQFRRVAGGPTEEVQSPISAPAFIRLERHADVFCLYVSMERRISPSGRSASLCKSRSMRGWRFALTMIRRRKPPYSLTSK